MIDRIRKAVCFLLLGVVVVSADVSKEGSELIGTEAPEWEASNWFNSEPLSLKELRGRVVLARWWTGPDCPYCAASAPHLNTWYDKYHTKGLVVIGVYHHKSLSPLSPQHLQRLVEEYSFQFPVAVDPEWRTLKRWWLDGGDHRWTSVSFLIDKQGVIRYIHPGGSYSQEESKEIESLIEHLLKQP